MKTFCYSLVITRDRLLQVYCPYCVKYVSPPLATQEVAELFGQIHELEMICGVWAWSKNTGWFLA